MANFWSQTSGTTLATLQETNTTTINLPLSEANATTAIISGSLPPGMRLRNNVIEGTPLEVARDTTYKFVVRATYNSQIGDRTFYIDVQGPDAPVWETPEDLLAIGSNNAFYILDSTPIDFQLVARDTDTAAGQVLAYFIGSSDGELPPGISLTTDGRLVGVVDPILAIEKAIGNGNYDISPFDGNGAPYDFGIRSSNGYDSFFYDTTIYDLSIPTRSPRKLNRYYEFTVSVSDGDTIARRTFRIFVVGDDFFRADNTLMQVSTGVFTADNTHIRTPIWLTPRDFGFRRANNYVTLYLDVLDPNSLTGVVTYELQNFNDDGTNSVLPPGMDIDATTGEIAGRVPYQPSVTKEYKFTVTANRLGPTSASEFVDIEIYEDAAVGSGSFKIIKNPNSTLLVNKTLTLAGQSYVVSDVNTTNENFDVITLGELVRIQIFETAQTGASSINIFNIGEPYLSSLVSKTLTSGVQNFTVQSVDDGAVFYKARTSHTSKEFLGDLGKTFWMIATSAEVAAAGTISPWTKDISYTQGDIVQHNPGRFETLQITAPLAAPVFAGNFINYILPITTTSIIKQGQEYSIKVVTDLNFEVAKSTKTFVVKLLGEVDSRITWLTDSNLGAISSNYISTLKVEAETSVSNALLLYEFVDGRLPPGLSLNFDGEIVGKIIPYSSVPNGGMTIFDTGNMVFDGNDTTVDRVFTFTVAVYDQFKYSRTEKTFTIQVADPDEKLYSNLTVKPFLNPVQRQAYATLISNPDIFIPEYIYRPNDPNFGIQKQIKMLIYAGIETQDIRNYMAVIAKNHKRKKFKLGAVKTAVAKTPGTNTVVYEVVYVDVIDPYMPTIGKTRNTFTIRNQDKITADIINYDTDNDATGLQNSEPFRNRPKYANTVKSDSNVLKVSDSNDRIRYISNLQNMRENILATGDTERNFLPLWMRSNQEGSVAELGYVSAIPLCYTKPGFSKIIANAISFTNFQFNQFDFDIDRYIIDNVTGDSNEKYLLFANYRFNI